MNKIKSLFVAAATFAATATGFSLEIPFVITYDFDADSSATVLDPMGAFSDVSDFMGGTVSGSALNATLGAGTPADFSFDFSLNSGYAATITGVGYNYAYTGQFGTIVKSFYGSMELGSHVLEASGSDGFALGTNYADVTMADFSVEAVGIEGTFSLEDFFVTGTIAEATAPSTVPDGTSALLGSLALAGLIVARRVRS